MRSSRPLLFEGTGRTLNYRETGIYSDQWLGTDPAVLQLAGTPECTSAQLVLTVDNLLLGSDVTVNYTDSTGYTGSFIIPNTEEHVELSIPVFKANLDCGIIVLTKRILQNQMKFGKSMRPHDAKYIRETG